jgi:hydrogenase assembly chaperone HypC/HupF
MCIPLIGKVLEIDGPLALVELTNGQEARVNASLHPDVRVGDYTLLDRGLIVQVIDEAEAESLMEFYAELDRLWEEEMAKYD